MNDHEGDSKAGEASLRACPSSSHLPLLLPGLPPQACNPSASEGPESLAMSMPHQGCLPCSPFPSGLSAASLATPGPCRPAETTFPSHPAAPPPPKANTAAAGEPQGLAMKNRCLPETCQPRLCSSLGSPPGSRGGVGAWQGSPGVFSSWGPAWGAAATSYPCHRRLRLTGTSPPRPGEPGHSSSNWVLVGDSPGGTARHGRRHGCHVYPTVLDFCSIPGVRDHECPNHLALMPC